MQGREKEGQTAGRKLIGQHQEVLRAFPQVPFNSSPRQEKKTLLQPSTSSGELTDPDSGEEDQDERKKKTRKKRERNTHHCYSWSPVRTPHKKHTTAFWQQRDLIRLFLFPDIRLSSSFKDIDRGYLSKKGLPVPRASFLFFFLLPPLRRAGTTSPSP